MKVLEVTLISIGAPLVIILCAALFLIPLVLDTKARESWRNIPREIYEAHRQRILGLPPTYFWIVAALLCEFRDLARWLKWNNADQLADKISCVLVATVLTYQLSWAIRIVRSHVSLDIRLVRFARYALWGSALGLLVTAGWASILFTSN